MRSTMRASGNALPPPQAGKLVVMVGGATEHLVVESLGGGEEAAGAARELGLACGQRTLAIDQLSLERLERVQGRTRGQLGRGRRDNCSLTARCSSALEGDFEHGRLGLFEAEVGAKAGSEICGSTSSSVGLRRRSGQTLARYLSK